MKMKISVNRLPYYRMTGYTATVLMHTINTYVVLGNLRGDVMEDPNIQFYAYFMYKFITCWTFAAQTIYATLGLSCDLLTLSIGDQYKFLKHVKQARNVFFASIVLPFSLMVSSIFWPIFLYDRELILPYYTTKIIGVLSNHVMHTAIVPVVLWELVFQPRHPPSSHKQNVGLMMAFAAFYLAVIFKTYFEIGLFPYPLMTTLYGSVYFFMFVGVALGVLPAYYCLQWHVSGAMWGHVTKGKRS